MGRKSNNFDNGLPGTDLILMVWQQDEGHWSGCSAFSRLLSHDVELNRLLFALAELLPLRMVLPYLTWAPRFCYLPNN